jgi:hypothetical protein
MYTFTKDNYIIRDLDGAFIPIDANNRDYQDYLAWISEGNTPTPYTPPPPTTNDVVQERARRLALGFDYDFADARGIHHIGTTDQDMIGWDDVTKYAAALIAKNDTTTTISIITNTGPTTVTALEWQDIIIASAAFRQPLWAKSFILQAMNPIPSNYTDDTYWT